MVRQTLEERVDNYDASRFDYKSDSEKIVAKIFEKYKIPFIYEDRILVNVKYENGDEKRRLWYPDFHLNLAGIVVEYEGRYKGESKEDYQERINSKREIYKENGIKQVGITPDDIWEQRNGKYRLREDYEERVLGKLVDKLKDEGYGKFYPILVKAKMAA